MEGLASELSLSGGNAFEKLQGTVTSQLTVDFELDGKTQKMPMPALINLRSHPDEGTRHRAYDAENKAWESVKETLAACMNGVKGEDEHAEQAARPQGRGAFRRWTGGAHRPQDAGCHAGRDRKPRSPCSANISRPRRRSWGRKSWRGGTSSHRWARPTRSIPSKRRAISSWRTSASSRPTCAPLRSGRSTTTGSTPSSGKANAAARSAWGSPA